MKFNKDFIKAVEHIMYQLKLSNSSYPNKIYYNGMELYLRPVIQFNTGFRTVEVYDKYGVLKGNRNGAYEYSYPKLTIKIDDNLLKDSNLLSLEIINKLKERF